MTLLKASDKQRNKIVENNFVEWGKQLTMDEYKKREERLSKIFLDDLITWISVDSCCNILAHCETIKHSVEIFHWISHSQSVGVKKGFCYAVASVFVPEHRRKNGFGTTMMVELKTALKIEEPESIVSTLFSDIGPDFYGKLGWNVISPVSLLVDLQTYQKSYQVVADSVDESGAKFLLEEDTVQLREEARRNVEQQNNLVLLFIAPSMKKLKWFQEISKIYAEKFNMLSHISAAQFGHKILQDGNLSWFLYFCDIEEKILYILRHRVSTSDGGKILLDNAYDVACSCGFHQIVIWNPDPHLSNLKVPGITAVNRTKESLPSLMMLNDSFLESRPYKIEWLANEKYCWV